MKYVLVDCCPVPAKLAPTLDLILHESGAVLQSCYRADDAAALLAKCGKHSQTWLFQHQGRPEQPNPANPPGRSTHELRNDGVAYRGPAGIRLPYWCVGIDVDDAHVQAFIRAAAKHGLIATVTYPGDRREYHHINFRKQPMISLWLIAPLKRHSRRSARVWLLKKRLRKLGYIKGKVNKGFTAKVEDAVKAFQRDHHQKPDGIVGIQTWHQLSVAVRKHKKVKK
jgi:hypothetical protein